MRILKTFGILIIVAIAVALILTLLLPTSRRIERQITINAAPAVVYEYLSKLDNFNKWSAWSNNDQSLKHTITGNDGTLGATSTWKGDPELSGEGQIKISSLEINREVEHKIHFLSPNKMDLICRKLADKQGYAGSSNWLLPGPGIFSICSTTWKNRWARILTRD
jgi:hypothetical protein